MLTIPHDWCFPTVDVLRYYFAPVVCTFDSLTFFTLHLPVGPFYSSRHTPKPNSSSPDLMTQTTEALLHGSKASPPPTPTLKQSLLQTRCFLTRDTKNHKLKRDFWLKIISFEWKSSKFSNLWCSVSVSSSFSVFCFLSDSTYTQFLLWFWLFQVTNDCLHVF